VTQNRRDLKGVGPSISEPSGRSVAKIVETKVRDLGFDAGVRERTLNVIDREHLIAFNLLANHDRSIACLPIRYSPLTNHVVDRSRLEPQHLCKLLHIQEPRTVRSDSPAFVRHFNSGAHRLTSTTCIPPLFSHRPGARYDTRVARRAVRTMCQVVTSGNGYFFQLDKGDATGHQKRRFAVICSFGFYEC